MKIYTRTGDEGKTSLLGGTRTEKSDYRIEAYGTVDELNSWMGLLRAHTLTDSALIIEIQEVLFAMSSHLAADDTFPTHRLPSLHEEDIQKLESAIDEMEAHLPVLKNFVLPGDTVLNAWVHIARTVCRRAERQVYRVQEKTEIHRLILPYLNRLADYLFVLARHVTYSSGGEETAWKPRV